LHEFEKEKIRKPNFSYFMRPEETNLVESYGNPSRLKKRMPFAQLSPIG
jgi:hypothetical protein